MGPIGVGKGFREMVDFGLVDKMPALGLVQSTGCAPMVEAFQRGQRIATPIENPETLIATLATGNPGRAYELLYDYVQEHGGHFVAANDEEAFNAIRILARNDGISVEPATGVAFAGLFKMVREGIIKPDDVVVVNCSGHTLPVETHDPGRAVAALGRPVAARRTRRSAAGRSGLGAGADGIAGRRIVVIEDNVDAARLIKRVLQARQFDVHVAHNGAKGLEMVREVHARPGHHRSDDAGRGRLHGHRHAESRPGASAHPDCGRDGEGTDRAKSVPA